MEERQPSSERQPRFAEKLATGIAGLDEILHGGLPRRHLYLVQGDSGTGKTTLGMQFLRQGVRRGESAMLITLAEVASDLHEVAHSHGWSLDGLEIYELPPLKQAQLENRQTIFPTAEVELSEATDQIISILRQKRPQRVVFDSLTELRLLAAGPARFRYQMLALSDVLSDIKATVLLIDRLLPETADRVLDSLVHGIIQLRQDPRAYGAVRRRLLVSKMRGMRYQEGWHDFRIHTGGVQVYPRLRVGDERAQQSWEQLSSGLPGLDSLLGGGLEFGTACLIGGASGTGKSSVAALFVHTALQQGVPAAMLLFDERPESLFKRSRDLNVPLRPYVEQGLLTVTQIETGETSAGEFAYLVRELIEEQGVRVLVVDSLTGYLRAMPEDRLLLDQIHDLVSFLSRRNVLTLLVATQHGLVGEQMKQALDVSYISDTVMLLRHFEAGGALHHAISVVKKRHGQHERTIRELRLLAGGVHIGEPLQGFRGVLTGNPEFVGRTGALLPDEDDGREG